MIDVSTNKIVESVAILGLSFLTACGIVFKSNSPASGTSKIVAQVEAAGAGPVDNASKEALFYWFRDRIPLTLAINKQCKEIRSSASAAWEDTAEGRVCAVTRDIAATRGQ